MDYCDEEDVIFNSSELFSAKLLITVKRKSVCPVVSYSFLNSIKTTQTGFVEWMNTYIYIAPIKQKSSEALAAE